jgi:acyl carrier protein
MPIKKNQPEIRQSIRTFLHDNFPRFRQLTMKDEDSLMEKQLVDSLGLLSIITFLEADFEIVISEEDIVSHHFASIKAISEFVEKKISETCS